MRLVPGWPGRNRIGVESVCEWAIPAKAFSDPASACTATTPISRPLVDRETPSAMLPATRSWRVQMARMPARAMGSMSAL